MMPAARIALLGEVCDIMLRHASFTVRTCVGCRHADKVEDLSPRGERQVLD